MWAGAGERERERQTDRQSLPKKKKKIRLVRVRKAGAETVPFLQADAIRAASGGDASVPRGNFPPAKNIRF